MKTKRKPPRRWLKLAELAELMQIEHPDPAYRRQYVWRLIRRIEKRDGAAYMVRSGGPRSPLRVSPAAIEQLQPYSPTAVGKLADDVEELREQHAECRLRINAHGSKLRSHSDRLRSLEKARHGFELYMKATCED